MSDRQEPTPRVQELMIQQEEDINQLHAPLAKAVAAALRTFPSNQPVTLQAGKQVMKVVDAHLQAVYGPAAEEADTSAMGLLVQDYARKAARLQVQQGLDIIRQQVGDVTYAALVQMAADRRKARKTP